MWLLIFVLILFTPSSGGTQVGKSAAMNKLSTSLIALENSYRAHLALGTKVPYTPEDFSLNVVGNRIVIDGVASADAEALKADLLALGLREAMSYGRMVSGELPIASIPALVKLPSLKFAQPAIAVTHRGLVTTQGDAAIRSDIARSAFGVDGTGSTVGVLSDSFNCKGEAANDFNSNDLPPVTVLQEDPGCSLGTDEGRAMLQIIHDIAPGASLAFATALGGQAGFANNIMALKNHGARVMVDDVIYLAEPMFQDGIIAQAVDSVVSQGVAYFSAAGNNARNAYSSAFRPGTAYSSGAIPSASGAPHFWGGVAHDFDTGPGTDVFQRITLQNGQGFLMSFQWDSPAFSVSGGSGSTNDLDVYVLNAAANQILAGSVASNIGGDPTEIFLFVNTTGVTADFNIMITNFFGSNPEMIKYVLFHFGGIIQEYATHSGTIYGHANSVGARAVGAGAYFDTPAFGVSPPLLQPFSSSGGTPILFDAAGNRLASPDSRSRKPEIVAPDGVNTTVTGFANFFGTSAAAPHAAGAAALLLHAKPSLQPGKIYRSFENTAIDMNEPGFDQKSGFGLIQVDLALAAALQATPIDFDGDGRSDVGIYRNGAWSILTSPGLIVAGWGGPDWIPVVADYDGDGKADVAVYNPIGVWSIVRSSDGGNTVVGWGGGVQDIPAAGDYDGDGKADVAIYRDGAWSIIRSSDGGVSHAGWGGPQWSPVVADYDGDGKADIAVYNSIGVWSIVRSSDGGNTVLGWGGPGWIPVPADYDGDGKTDIAVYHPAGVWSIVRSSDGGNTVLGWGGGSQDIPLN